MVESLKLWMIFSTRGREVAKSQISKGEVAVSATILK